MKVVGISERVTLSHTLTLNYFKLKLKIKLEICVNTQLNCRFTQNARELTKALTFV
jgi:hypothetical protein